MTSSAPLRGTDLIDCARANAPKGIEVAAQRCGYGSDLSTFEHELQKAGDRIGVEIHGFTDLLHPGEAKQAGVEVGPDTLSEL
jgi:hypothetical protein